MAYIGGSQEKLVVDTTSLAQTGQNIVQNATDLGTQIQHNWSDFQKHYEALPSFPQSVLADYYTARSKELANLLQRRQQVGQLLQTVSNLYEFNEQALQTMFKGMQTGIAPDASGLLKDLIPGQH